MTSPDDPGSTKPHVAVDVTVPRRPTPYLIVLQGATAGQVVKLDRPSCVIGRADTADFRLADLGISGSHAIIRVATAGEVSIQDLRSTNGTRVNDERLDGIQKLEDGDKISMGATTILKFTFDDALKTSLEQQLADVGRIDPLTGAYREKYFTEFVRAEFAYAQRHRTALSVILVSIDHFQTLVDERGNAVADQVLVEFSRRVREVLHGQHLFARLGHRSFGLLCRALPSAQAFALADEIRLAVAAAPVEVGVVSIEVTVSASIASLPLPGIDTPKAFLRVADIGLHDAKVTHNCVVVTSERWLPRVREP
jgi:two-component system cell cycle response regulator